jgi:hypothetical protein
MELAGQVAVVTGGSRGLVAPSPKRSRQCGTCDHQLHCESGGCRRMRHHIETTGGEATICCFDVADAQERRRPLRQSLTTVAELIF